MSKDTTELKEVIASNHRSLSAYFRMLARTATAAAAIATVGCAIADEPPLTADGWRSVSCEGAAPAPVDGAVDTDLEAALVATRRAYDPADLDPNRGEDFGWGGGYGWECEDINQVAVRAVADGYEVSVIRYQTLCSDSGSSTTSKEYREVISVDGEGNMETTSSKLIASSSSDGCAVAGRRPPGHVELMPEGPESPGAFLARIAYLEDAAVIAFERLGAELSLLGAPSELVSACAAAAADEVRHAAAVKKLAEARGESVRAAEADAVAPRSLFELALDNAAEGCVRETFAAALAYHQAEHAADADVREVMAVVAEDETRHASLSWQLHAWLETQLSTAERVQVRLHALDALEELEMETQRPVSATATNLGFPERRPLKRIYASVRELLWRPEFRVVRAA